MTGEGRLSCVVWVQDIKWWVSAIAAVKRRDFSFFFNTLDQRASRNWNDGYTPQFGTLILSRVACRQCFYPFISSFLDRPASSCRIRTGCTIIHFASVEFLHPVENLRLWTVSRFTPKSIILWLSCIENSDGFLARVFMQSVWSWCSLIFKVRLYGGRENVHQGR
jgi:hypothetical protein